MPQCGGRRGPPNRLTKLEIVSEQGQVKTDELDAQAEAKRRLALAQIRQYPDPVLRLEAQQVQDFDDDLKQLVERMTRLMQDARGVGLAANQVGVLRRVFVIQAEDEEPRALVNPSIVERSDESGEDDEGCLSMQGVVVSVERPVRVRLEASDEQGNPVELELEGLPARVAQHELDHLDGVLILDRTTLRRPPRGDGRPAAIRHVVRLAVAATAPLGADVLERLADKHEIEFLLTRPDRPRGRGRKVGAPPAKETAERLGIPVRQDEQLDESFSLDDVDTVVVVAYGALIPASLLDRALWLNVHPSLAPALARRRAHRARDHGRRRRERRLGDQARRGARRRPDRGAAQPLDRRRHDGGRRLCGDGSSGARADRRGARQRLVLTPGRRADLRGEDRPRRPRARLVAPAEGAPRPDPRAQSAHRRPGRAPRPQRHRLALATRRRPARAARGAAGRRHPHVVRSLAPRPTLPTDELEGLGARSRDRAVALRGGLLAARRADRDRHGRGREDLPVRRRRRALHRADHDRPDRPPVDLAARPRARRSPRLPPDDRDALEALRGDREGRRGQRHRALRGLRRPAGRDRAGA